MKKLILWGSSGQAIVIEEFISTNGFSIIAVFDNNPNATSIDPSIPIYYGKEGFNKWYSNYDKAEKLYGIAAIGGDKGIDRSSMHSFFIEKGIEIVTLIHPSAYVAKNAKVGRGSQILAHVTVAAKVCIDDDTILNTACSVDHETKIGKGVHIGPGAHVAGCVTIEEYSFIGTGAVILPRIHIGNNTIIGAGAVVTRDVPDLCVCYGNPAIVRRFRDGSN